mgnify:CR=1 FL=1
MKNKVKITLEFAHEDLIDLALITKAINGLMHEKEEIDNSDITLYWENQNIYVKKMKTKNDYKIQFGEPKWKLKKKNYTKEPYQYLI